MIETQPFKLGLADQSRFFWAWYRQNMFSRANLIRIAIGTVILTIATLSVSSGFASTDAQVVLLVISLISSLITSAIIVYALLPTAHWLLDLAIFAVQKAGRRNCQVVLAKESITNRINETESLVGWSQVKRIKAGKQAILLFTGRNSAIIVPRRAFATKEDSDNFLSYAQAQIEPF